MSAALDDLVRIRVVKSYNYTPTNSPAQLNVHYVIPAKHSKSAATIQHKPYGEDQDKRYWLVHLAGCLLDNKVID